MGYRLPSPHRWKPRARHDASQGAVHLATPQAPRLSLDELMGEFRRECVVNREPRVLLPGRGQLKGVSGLGPAQQGIDFDWEAGRRYMTHAGFRVRSKAEKIIADFLTASDLKFLYEPALDLDGAIVRPDFYLCQYGLPYEHFGLATLDYLRAAEEKVTRYHRAGIPFIYTTFNDESDIEDVFVEKLAMATMPC